MPSFRPLTDYDRPPGGHLDHLREDLDQLGRRLRAGIADAVARSVAEAVRDGVLAVLTADSRHRSTPPRRPPESYGRPPLWHEPAEDDPADEGEYPLSAGWGYAEAGPAPAPSAPTLAQTPRWLPALAAGSELALCWLRRRPGEQPVPPALAVGLVAGVVAFRYGTMAGAIVGAVGSALGLVALADAAHSVGDALAAVLNPEEDEGP